MEANERQVGGRHYESKYAHWDFTLEVLENRYLEGNITKYVTRARKKNGLQDLEKAEHYLQKLIEDCYEHVQPIAKGRGVAKQCYVTSCVDRFVAANGLNASEAAVINGLANWHSRQGLHLVRDAIDRLIHQANTQAAA